MKSSHSNSPENKNFSNGAEEFQELQEITKELNKTHVDDMNPSKTEDSIGTFEEHEVLDPVKKNASNATFITDEPPANDLVLPKITSLVQKLARNEKNSSILQGDKLNSAENSFEEIDFSDQIILNMTKTDSATAKKIQQTPSATFSLTKDLDPNTISIKSMASNKSAKAKAKEDTVDVFPGWDSTSMTTPLVNVDLTKNKPKLGTAILNTNAAKTRVVLNPDILKTAFFRSLLLTQSTSNRKSVCMILIAITIIALIFLTVYPELHPNSFVAFIPGLNNRTMYVPWRKVRLPDTLIPYHYDIELRPILTPDKAGYYEFKGNSTVYFNVNEPTSYIILHSKQLFYMDVAVYNDMEVKVTSTFLTYERNDFLVVILEGDLAKSRNYSLRTLFQGALYDDLNGLYRSSFKSEVGKDVLIATTKMEPTNARKTFPCFDEPALKATFNITLWHNSTNFAISNMPAISNETMGDGWKKTTFLETVKMSTYLLAFVVCDFKYVESYTKHDVQTRIYARPQQIDHGNGNYAKNITPRILDFFEEYFQVNYPLPKSDQIAVPDFASGAMENWGLVIYRETALLYDPEINSAFNKQRVAYVVAHELVHQWFGNLVTPVWWDELWLNEGFATYIAYIGTDYIEPTWKMKDQFIVGEMYWAMLADSYTSSRPILQKVSRPRQIEFLFDIITYRKGACIIRMINRLLGDFAFKRGLTIYLKKNKYGTANHQQLFEAWSQTISDSRNPSNGLENAANTWINQTGFPVINMFRRTNSKTVTIHQKRFLLDHKNSTKNNVSSPYNYEWDIPFWFVIQGDKASQFMWLLRKEKGGNIAVEQDKYFIGNYGAFGYYRVNYDEENWNRIISQLNNNFSVIEVKTRGQLISDAFNLARAHLLSYEIALGLTEFLRKDFEYVSWQNALNSLSFFETILINSYVFKAYTDYLLYLSEPLYKYATWTDEGSHLQQFTEPLVIRVGTTLLEIHKTVENLNCKQNMKMWFNSLYENFTNELFQQINALSIACEHGYDDCINQTTRMFASWMYENSTNSISPNLRTIVYCNGIRYGGVKEWDFAFEQYINETNSQEKAKIESGLTCTRSQMVIASFLNQHIFNNSVVRIQDTGSFIRGFCLNKHTQNETWSYIRKNWKKLNTFFQNNLASFHHIVKSCTSFYSTKPKLKELFRFRRKIKNIFRSGLGAINKAIKQTKANIKWRVSHEALIYNWLSAKLTEVKSKE